jgi:hypothetical protein
VISWRLASGLGFRLPTVLHTSTFPPPSHPPRNYHRYLHLHPFPSHPRTALVMSRRYDSRVRICLISGTPAQTDLRNIDHHLLPRGPSLPGRIRARGHLARGYSSGRAGTGWNRARGGAEGHEQAVGAGYERREAVHSERVSASFHLLHHGSTNTVKTKQHDLCGCGNDGRRQHPHQLRPTGRTELSLDLQRRYPMRAAGAEAM